jgi:N-methylhydantoinase A
MKADASKSLTEAGFGSDKQTHSFTVDMRYVGQSYTLSVPLDENASEWDDVRRAFAQRHTETFGHADENNDAEIVNIRLVSLGIVDKPTLAFTSGDGKDLIVEERKVWFGDDWMDCPIYNRDRMQAGFSLVGPAIIEESGGTSIVPPGWKVTVLEAGSLDCRNPQVNS